MSRFNNPQVQKAASIVPPKDGDTKYGQIVDLVSQAASLARTVEIKNLLQPGLVKEMILAEILGHQLIHTKRDADACSPQDPTLKYEYLSCKEGGTGQLDRMFQSPPDKRAASLRRITRNHKVYLAIFYADNQTTCKTIYEVEPEILLRETERQLDRSKNVISHVGFSESWAKRHGCVVYPDPAGSV